MTAVAQGADVPSRMRGTDAVTKDHDRIRNLFQQYSSLDSNDKAGKLSVARQIVTVISQHASAEERMIYPLIKSKLPAEQGGKLLYDLMVTDDSINKLCLEYLHTHSPTTDAEWQTFDLLMNKFVAIENEHLSKEEVTVLEPLAKVLTQEENEDLCKEFEAALRSAPLYPHPYVGGTTALPAQILHPIAGVVDKASTAVTGVMHKMWQAGEHALGRDKNAAAPPAAPPPPGPTENVTSGIHAS